MDSPGFLYALGGVSMSMMGFTGLIAALRGADARRPQQLFRIGIIVWHCLAATFLALFPVALYGLLLDQTVVLRLSSAILAAFAIDRQWRSFQSRKMWRSEAWIVVIGYTIRTVDSAVALANMVVGSLGLYELALLLLLGMPAFSFALLFTFDMPRDEHLPASTE